MLVTKQLFSLNALLFFCTVFRIRICFIPIRVQAKSENESGSRSSLFLTMAENSQSGTVYRYGIVLFITTA